MEDMGSVRLTYDIPSLEDRIRNFCQEKRDKRKHEWESLRVALEKIKEGKVKQCHQ